MPPKVSREGSDRLTKILLAGLTLNAIIGFAGYYIERSKQNSKQAQIEQRLEAAKDAAALNRSECVGLVGRPWIRDGARCRQPDAVCDGGYHVDALTDGSCG